MFLAENSIQLVPDGTLLLHLLMVAVMVAVLNRTLLKPINQILTDRENQIQETAADARALAAAREAKVQQYNSALREARAEGYRLLEAERAQLVREKEQRVLALKEELHKTVSTEIELTRKHEEQVRGELETQARGISEEICTQVLGRGSQ